MRVGSSGPVPVLRSLVVGAAELVDEAGYQGPDGGSLYMSLAMCTPWLVCPLTVLYTLSITKNSISTVSSELGIWMNRWHRSSENSGVSSSRISEGNRSDETVEGSNVDVGTSRSTDIQQPCSVHDVVCTVEIQGEWHCHILFPWE